MRSLPAIVALALVAAPAAAGADQGALTLEIGPSLSFVGASPSQGSGSTVVATLGGGLLGVRYALSNEFEVSASALWEAPADYFHSGVQFGTPSGAVRGTLSERVQRVAVLGGVQYVRGVEWRFHLGAEAGWSRETFSRRDLLDVSDPSNVHSFGLGLQDRTIDSLMLAPVVGVEWQFADHWSVSLLPRVQFFLGGASRIGLLVPLSVGYSWFVF
jgi:hypothetical protein